MDQLRRIAIWVHETETGSFQWVLTEVNEAGRLRDIHSSEHEFISFEGALDEGVDALKNMSADLDVGPRRETEDAEAQMVS